MARSTFARVMPEILAHEGGYADHPRDPGGATKFGITHTTLASWRGRPVSKADVRALTTGEATQIYETRYWRVIKGDALPYGVDYAVLDFAINSGPGRAASHLQKVLGVAQDGIIGPVTLKALFGMGRATVINRLCDSRLAFLRGLSNWPTFGKGWAARVAKVRATALRLANTGAVPPPPDIEPIDPKPAPKPGEALGRIIGFIVAALLAAAAAAAAYFGA